MPTAQAQGQAPAPGAYFDIPGIPGGSTQWTEQDETTIGNTTTLSGSTQVPLTGVNPFKQTDVVVDWIVDMEFSSLAWTAGIGQTLTNSNYAPWNIVGPVQLLIQNQYASVDVESGIDIYIFNVVRPYTKTDRRNNMYANPAGNPIGNSGTAANNAIGYDTGNNGAGIAQPLLISPGAAGIQWANTATVGQLIFRLPCAQWFDDYYDLAVTGEPIEGPLRAVVSPQYMAGTTRVITPVVRMNPGIGATTDVGPVYSTAVTSATQDTASTFSGTLTTNFRRRAVYAGAQTVMPPVFAWQYRWKTTRFSIAGVSRADLLVPLDTGQLLLVYVRLFDPAASSSKGLPISLANISRANLQYGSGLFRFDHLNSSGGMYEWQREAIQRHGALLPPGVIVFDLALDDLDRLSNRRALNTLTTAGILVHLEFTGAQSSSAYAVMGTESLVYVT